MSVSLGPLRHKCEKKHGDYLMGLYFGNPVYGYSTWINILSKSGALPLPQPPSIYLPDFRLWYCRYCGQDTMSDRFGCCQSCGAPKLEEEL